MNEKLAAIVTGASSGIGRAIAEELQRSGYAVFGFGRDFSGDETFHCLAGDLLDSDWVYSEVEKLRKEYAVSVLVNNAGVGRYGLHETLKPQDIAEMVRVNLEVPMALTAMLLPELKRQKGHVINITSVTADGENTHGCAYGATKAGLSSFTRSLFAEARKSGLRVTEIRPDMTDTNLYRDADFTASTEPGCSLSTEDVVCAVRYVLDQPEGVDVPLLTIRPQFHRIEKR